MLLNKCKNMNISYKFYEKLSYKVVIHLKCPLLTS